MSDTAEDMDEYIEYEYTRDCIVEIADDIELQDDGVEFITHDPESLLAQTAEHLQGEGFRYEDESNGNYEIVEEFVEDVEQVLVSDAALDIKTEILDADEEEKSITNEEFIDEEGEALEDHLIEDDDINMSNGYSQHQQQIQTQPAEGEDYEEIEYEEMCLDTEEAEEKPEPIIVHKAKMENKPKPSPLPCSEDKGPKGVPKKYMLYDELIATVIDFDSDGTPIVEFSMSNKETDEKLPMECGICPDVMSRSKITNHLKTHLVRGTNRYQCIYCEETYKDCKYLAGHARRHMGIRPYVCEICKLYFSTKQDLRVHNQRRHQEKDHICEVCGKTFAQNTQLKRHREATHERKRRFTCNTCPKSYYKNFSLQEHIRAVHLGKRRMIVCPFCGMQCRDAHKMARHRKQYHLHQTHFECNICNEQFTDINYFDAHKRSIQCRNNTRRKQEEEGVLAQLQEEQQEITTSQSKTLSPKQEILIEDDDNSQEEYSQHLLQTHHQPTLGDDTIETVQVIDENEYRQLIAAAHGQNQADCSGQFVLGTEDLLQHHKIEKITSDDVADDDELVYEITIDSNE